MEGLAISPDGSHVYALEQLPLLQDTKAGKKGKRQGLNCRLLDFDLKSGGTREYVYPLESHHTKLCEILAAGDRKFLVIERDGEMGDKAAFKKIIAIDLKQATDTSRFATLPPKGLPKHVQPVKKSTFIDLLDPRFGLSGDKCPEKIEGLALGTRRLPDGRAVLWVCVSITISSLAAPNLFYAFAVPRASMVTAHEPLGPRFARSHSNPGQAVETACWPCTWRPFNRPPA